MNTLSPVVSDAFKLLRQDLYLHLDNAEYVAENESESAQKLIQDLVTVVRGVVALHDTPYGARCKVCDGTWPCQAFETVHRLLKDPDKQFVKILNQRDR
jgi:hypothetical protein